jgi:hypothetical protein
MNAPLGDTIIFEIFAIPASDSCEASAVPIREIATPDPTGRVISSI